MDSLSLLLFWLDDNRYAISLEYIDRVYPAVEITAEPSKGDGAQELGFLGFVNVHASVTPVIDIRSRFGLPSRETDVHDMLIMAKDGDERLAFFVDGIDGVVRYEAEQLVNADSMLYANSKVKLLKLDNGLVRLNELRDFLSESAKKWLESKGQAQ